MTLDQLIILSDRLKYVDQRAKPYPRRMAVIALSLAASMACAHFRLPKIVLLIPLVVFGFSALRLWYWMFLACRLTWRIQEELMDRVERLPWSLQERAMNLFGDNWELAAIECHESHIPGDCPLCGAE
jgi:hypothetical protein